MTTSKKQTEALIMAGLNLIQPALSIYDQDLQARRLQPPF